MDKHQAMTVIKKRSQRFGPAVSKPLINAAGNVIKAVIKLLIWLDATPIVMRIMKITEARRPKLMDGEYHIFLLLNSISPPVYFKFLLTFNVTFINMANDSVLLNSYFPILKSQIRINTL